MSPKIFMKFGGLLTLGSLLVLSFLFIYAENPNHHQAVSLILNLLEILGLVILTIGLFFWSFLQPQKIKRLIWSFLGIAVFMLIVPLTSYCPELPHDNDPRTFENDVVICEVVFPYQPFYWIKVSQTIFNMQNQKDDYHDGGFVFFGGIFLILEKHDDFLWSLRRD